MNTTSDTEVQIAGNDRRHKTAFYMADGGGQASIELLEQNIFSAGFEDTGGGEFLVGIMAGSSLNFYMNVLARPEAPDDINRDVYMPVGYTVNQPHTNLSMGGDPSLSTGSAIQMAAGYEGKGKGVAGAGGHIIYNVASQGSTTNSDAAIVVQWKHIF